MDTTRFVLLVSLSLVIMLLWDAWQRDYGAIQSQPAIEDIVVKDTPALDVPALPEAAVTELPEIHSPLEKKAELIDVKTDLFHIQINLAGGNIEGTELLKFPVSLEEPDKKVRLLYYDSDTPYVTQGGLLSKDPAPTHDAMFTAQNLSYSLSPDDESLQVPMFWQTEDGLAVKKVYEFFRDTYLINVRYELSNKTAKPWSGRAYGQIQRTDPGSRMNGAVYTYTGAVISSPEKRYEKISFDDMQDEKLSRNIVNGWVAMIQHYFVSALIPGTQTEEDRYYTLFLDKTATGLQFDRFVIGLTTQPATAAPGETVVLEHKLYLGPKIQSRLEPIAPGLELTVDYGMLWFIAKPLFWCLEWFHSVVGNWGWSIILVTLMLKLLFYNLSAAGYRSMANMRRVQPKLLAIRDRYKNDRSRLNKAMMDIYKEEKINPLGGCFPILIQIPVFIALYWVLLESVELRQAGFILWIRDLSTPDPYFVLPVVMGVTMFVQQKLNPAPMDPVQEKVMLMLPFIFTVFFAFFPSGLVLYWVVNNILSIAQQWLIIRNLERAGLKT
jgi:YidC/Oxa1 family membrane protein insertase